MKRTISTPYIACLPMVEMVVQLGELTHYNFLNNLQGTRTGSCTVATACQGCTVTPTCSVLLSDQCGGKQGWKLYNGKHVLGMNPRFETGVLRALADELSPDERALLPLTWEAPRDAWDPYLASCLAFLNHRYLATKLLSSSNIAPAEVSVSRPIWAPSDSLQPTPIGV